MSLSLYCLIIVWDMIKLLLKVKMCHSFLSLSLIIFSSLSLSRSASLSSPGGFPDGSRRSVGSGRNRERVSEFYEETDPQVGSAVGYSRPEARPEAAQTMEGAEEGEEELKIEKKTLSVSSPRLSDHF